MRTLYQKNDTEAMKSYLNQIFVDMRILYMIKVLMILMVLDVSRPQGVFIKSMETQQVSAIDCLKIRQSIVETKAKNVNVLCLPLEK